ncbi:hypothetical protein CJU90_1829 [Yarrowia sp. C11]|nr:hypothetical protein CKK34_5857 [Yarrowia sp. E02]KAG5371767.1 hypothetical protein CJU90_1829 [Yarrowia sp. C11]
MATVAVPLASSLNSSKKQKMATNTLIITGLSRAHFTSEAFMLELKKALASDELVCWAPLKSLGRIVCVFVSIDSCSVAKKYIKQAAEAAYVDEEFLNYSTLKAQYAPNNTDMATLGDTKQLLQLPDAGKLFFISPPPSPPVGWTSRLEDDPNPQAFDSQFYDMLHKELSNVAEPKDDKSDDLNIPVLSAGTRKITLHEGLKLDTNQGVSSGMNSPTIILECEEGDVVSPGVSFAKTERPPVEL